MTTACIERKNEELAIIARGNAAALDKLIRQNEGFVVSTARTFLNRNGYYDSHTLADYSQICRLSIVKALKNYDPERDTRFITYAGKIMRNDMLKQMKNDSLFRENAAEVFIEESDTTAEECDEEYGDSYDTGFEDSRSFDYTALPSSTTYSWKEQVTIEQISVDEESQSARLGQYSKLLQKVFEEKEETPDPPAKDKKGETEYLDGKETEYSWKYPIFHKALYNMQLEAALEELLDKNFDPAQREYLIYRFGLKDLKPRSVKETAEHFHLSISYAKRIEKRGLAVLRDILKKSYLL